MLEPEQLCRELTAACEDAGIAPASVVAFIVASTRPTGTTPLAYLHPAGVVWPDTVAVFRAVGADRAARHHLSAHRLAIWHELPGIPDSALGPMLRHELEHARRWELSGTRFFEADDLLRKALRASGDHAYAAIPSEVEANAASAAYAQRVLSSSHLAEVRACAECEALLAPDASPHDVVAATLTELARRDDWAPQLGREERRAYLGEIERDCAEWDPANARGLSDGRLRPEIEVVVPPP